MVGLQTPSDSMCLNSSLASDAICQTQVTEDGKYRKVQKMYSAIQKVNSFQRSCRNTVKGHFRNRTWTRRERKFGDVFEECLQKKMTERQQWRSQGIQKAILPLQSLTTECAALLLRGLHSEHFPTVQATIQKSSWKTVPALKGSVTGITRCNTWWSNGRCNDLCLLHFFTSWVRLNGGCR